jgi:hypothetical protein
MMMMIMRNESYYLVSFFPALHPCPVSNNNNNNNDSYGSTVVVRGVANYRRLFDEDWWSVLVVLVLPVSVCFDDDRETACMSTTIVGFKTKEATPWSSIHSGPPPCTTMNEEYLLQSIGTAGTGTTTKNNNDRPPPLLLLPPAPANVHFFFFEHKSRGIVVSWPILLAESQ